MVNNNNYAPIESSHKHMANILEDLPMTEGTAEFCENQQQEDLKAQGAVKSSSNSNKKRVCEAYPKAYLLK